MLLSRSDMALGVPMEFQQGSQASSRVEASYHFEMPISVPVRGYEVVNVPQGYKE